MQTNPSIAIIGAGPAGLMAAECLAAAGCRVTVYDQMATPARKFLIAGRGGLNLTHSEPLPQFLTRYRGLSPMLAHAIEAFPPEQLRAWCEGLGEETFVGSSGRVFPRRMKAASLLRTWLARLEGLGVQYAARHRWQGWDGSALKFSTPAGDAVTVMPDATLLALGGASWPRLGSDGAWTQVLGARGIAISPLKPANSGFVVPWSDYLSERFAGQPLKPLAITHDGLTLQGEAMVTKDGLEGGVVYAHSAAIREDILRTGTSFVALDLRPGMTADALAAKLGTRGNKSLSSFLRSGGLSPLAIALLHETTPMEQLRPMNTYQLSDRLKALPLTLTATAGMARAISSAGGISWFEMDDDWMLARMPGVFVAGEMLDWEAPTGGYLLQACFSSAVAAAEGMLRYVDAAQTGTATRR